jgi:hypothetical protein
MYVLLDTYNTTRCVYPITWNLQHIPRAQHISDYRAKHENKKQVYYYFLRTIQYGHLSLKKIVILVTAW